MQAHPRRTDPVYEITGTRRGLEADLTSRTRRYLLSMGVRTACVLLAVVTVGWLRWVFAVGAVLLPYVAVIFANGGREANKAMPVVDLTHDRPQLEGPVRLPTARVPTDPRS